MMPTAKNGPLPDPASTRALLDRLSAETLRWFKSVSTSHDLEDHKTRLLLLACQAWDRGAEARARLDAEGLTVEGRQGVKTHPAVKIEHDSREAFARIVKQLKLDDPEKPRRVGRPAHGFGITFDDLNRLRRGSL
jgi:phage terminase small subunit